ncbi:hypothetical protein [Streptomyces tremellae]|uniref:hypothetical protein n=1 Tax=Streptomyces tremellae TaxID=1124239 RepID=UPI0031EF2A7E
MRRRHLRSTRTTRYLVRTVTFRQATATPSDLQSLYRWVVERSFAWLLGFRRLRVRRERRADHRAVKAGAEGSWKARR